MSWKSLQRKYNALATFSYAVLFGRVILVMTDILDYIINTVQLSKRQVSSSMTRVTKALSARPKIEWKISFYSRRYLIK